MNIKIEDMDLYLEFLEIQKYKNMEIIPIKTKYNENRTYLTLKRGMDTGIVEINECESSTVSTVLARNNSIIPLLLIDGDEITGAKQNRIMNISTIIPPKSNIPISVSCTEQGRWHYNENYDSSIERDNIKTNKKTFSFSKYAADYNTRRAKSQDLFHERNCQSTVWDSIDKLQTKTSYQSKTNALNDSYENLKIKQNEYLEHFKIEFGQVGAIFIINGEIKGLELFHDPSTYYDYHEKIFRSYIMEAITNMSSITGFYMNDIKSFVNEITNSQMKHSETKGLGQNIKFSNRYGDGAILIHDNKIIHMNYFKNPEVKEMNGNGPKTRVFKDFREFSENY